MRLTLAAPRGFCAGVSMAIEALDRALAEFGAPLYAFHQIVHNAHIVREYERKGVHFVDDLALVPVGQTVVFSAHGVSPAVRAQAAERELTVVDATCPLVTKVHSEAQRFARKRYTVLLIGHHGHDETVGIVGEAPEQIVLVEDAEAASEVSVADPTHVAYLTQTTLSVTDTAEIISILRRRFPEIVGPSSSDICYATENRQRAVAVGAEQADVVLVLGSENSSNTNRLVEEGRRAGRSAYRIEGPADIDPDWLAPGSINVLLTAGASVRESLVQETVEWLRARGVREVREVTVARESIEFRLPRIVRPGRTVPPRVATSEGLVAVPLEARP